MPLEIPISKEFDFAGIVTAPSQPQRNDLFLRPYLVASLTEWAINVFTKSHCTTWERARFEIGRDVADYVNDVRVKDRAAYCDGTFFNFPVTWVDGNEVKFLDGITVCMWKPAS